MASQGPLYPGTTATSAVSPYDDNDWTSIANIVSDNNVFASITIASFDSPDYSYRVVASNFGFTIPTGATINGIVVSVGRYYAGGSVADALVALYNPSTSTQSDNKSAGATWPTTEGIGSFGSSSDLWGIAWTAAAINSADFAVRFACQATGTDSDAYVDYIRVAVYYTVTYTLTAEQGSLTFTGQDISLQAARQLAAGEGSFTLAGQDVTLTYTPVSGRTLTAEQGSFTFEGQSAGLVAARILTAVDTSYALAGQDVAFSKTNVLTCTVGEFTFTGQALSLVYGRIIVAVYGSFALTGYAVTLVHALYEPTGDMITFGTLLTRIQSALGDPLGTTWTRATTVWQWAQDALRAFPILRPRLQSVILTEAGHTFQLSSDFVRIIYVEYPLYQDPPAYLTHKNHLDADFYYNTGFYDVDHDFTEGSYYTMYISDELDVDDGVLVRYMAHHQHEFTSETSLITVENQYVHILINHVVMMAYAERLALQLQDPTAHTSTIQQMAVAVQTAEKNYLDALEKATSELNPSKQISGWKVDKHDRIY